MNKKSVLMLHQFHEPHPAHRVFAEAVGADYRHFETGEPIGGAEANTGSMLDRLTNAITLNQYDIVIGEGTIPIYTLLFYKMFNNWDADVVPLIADESFLRISQQRTHHLWKHGIGRMMSESISGAIAVSELCREWSQPYLDTDFRIVHPCIDDQKYDLLSSITRSYRLNEPIRILHAGTVSDEAAVKKKNVDLLSKVISNTSGWQLRLLGEGHNQFDYSSLSGVEAPGYIKELSEFAAEFEHADIYVQSSSGDAFPVASLEAMLAGIPTIVTKETGTREVVEQVDRNLVREATPHDIKSGIEYVMSLSNNERKDIGERLSTRVADLTEHNQAERFRNALEDLTS